MYKFLIEDTRGMEIKFNETIDFLQRKGGKFSLSKPLLDRSSRELVQSIYNELDKALVGSGDIQLFLRSLYKVIYYLANTTELPIEDNFDNPQVEFKKGLNGLAKYGRKIDLDDLDLGVSTKKHLKRMLLDFKKLKNSGTVFKFLDKIRLMIEIIVDSSQDGLIESKINSLCEAWSVE